MLIVVRNQIVIALHYDTQDISLSLYPSAQGIKRIIDGVPLEVGMADPSLDHPEYLLPAQGAFPSLYVHHQLTGGDGLTPPGITNDHIDFLSCQVDIRAGMDPTSDYIDLNGVWRVIIRDSQQQEYDVIKVALLQGHTSFLYRTNLRPAICHLTEQDLETITIDDVTYRLHLVNPLLFKVFRTL